MKRLFWATILICAAFSFLGAGPEHISQMTGRMQKLPGFFPLYWEEGTGKIWLEIDRFDEEFLYQTSLATGVGSFELRLDRNRFSSTRVVKFKRIGPKVLLIQMNYDFRAVSEDPAVRQNVEEAFAQSVLWGFAVEAEENGRVLVDASSFFLRDAHNVVGILRRRDGANYVLDASRSAIYMPRTKNFPLNTEIEALLTFTSDFPGSLVRRVAPDPRSVSLRLHHSLVQLPDAAYTPRAFDPRSGFLETHYMDFASPIGEPIMKRWIIRFRLNKKDPLAEMSDPVKPIVFYVERGIPEPIRSAVMEGASWWNQAFEAIGYRNAFQVKLLPEGADPMDFRYNVINWVHRSSRGWSYAGMIWDPRTGEFLKGNIVLESQRIREDFLVAEGLIAEYEEGKQPAPEMQDMVLARIRQLSCHEVGHILGLDHNFASSANDRASVMDYPYSMVEIKKDGSLDLSDAYAKGIGEWDKAAIAYGYQDFPEGTDEHRELGRILEEAFSRGLHLLTNNDTVPDGSAHPLAHRWDNGRHPVDELEQIMRIRSAALNKFSEKKIRHGDPLALLEDALVPVYLFHRYQIVAASKVLGGLYYTYAVRGDGQRLPEIVPASEQRRALDVLLDTIRPKNLAIDENILRLIPPRPLGYGQTPELFPGHTGLTFDPLAAAETVAAITIPLLLNPERAARLEEYHARDNTYPDFHEVLDRLITATWKTSGKTGFLAAIERVVENVMLYHLIHLAVNEQAASYVRAVAMMKLDELKTWLNKRIEAVKDRTQRTHYFSALSQIRLFQKDPEAVKLTAPFAPPKSVHNPPLGAHGGVRLHDWIQFGSDWEN